VSAPTLRDAAATLAAAFHDGALFGYAEPDAVRRAQRLPWLFEGTLLHCRRHGDIEVVAAAAGVAGWVPGTRLALTPADLVRTGLIATPARLGPAPTARLERHERPSEVRLEQHLTEATSYLWVLGVDPVRQGEGLGAAVLQAALAAMHAAGFERCLLRTDDEPNVAFYRRQGFEVEEELDDLPSGLPSWILAGPTGR
jgi:ribosomal protein S18 acetylase RimI-like enzyme